MTIVNTRKYAGDNSENIFTLSVTDINNHDLPDTDGDDSAGGDAFTTEGVDRIAAKVHNAQDQDATVSLEATHWEDTDFAHAETLVSGVTVSAGGGVETLVGDSSVPFDWYRVIVSFGTAPTGNSEIEVAYLIDDNGD